ncbi:hypothetical protein [Granulicella mallensis]
MAVTACTMCGGIWL